jgi:hypothetical protein
MLREACDALFLVQGQRFLPIVHGPQDVRHERAPDRSRAARGLEAARPAR